MPGLQPEGVIETSRPFYDHDHAVLIVRER